MKRRQSGGLLLFKFFLFSPNKVKEQMALGGDGNLHCSSTGYKKRPSQISGICSIAGF